MFQSLLYFVFQQVFMWLLFLLIQQEEETEEDLACQELEKELADKGLNITADTLQRWVKGFSKYHVYWFEI